MLPWRASCSTLSRNAKPLYCSAASISSTSRRTAKTGRLQLADCFERFPLRGVAWHEPLDIEPWDEHRSDIDVRLVRNIRELIMHPTAPRVIDPLTTLQDATHVVERDIAREVDQLSIHRLSEAGQRLYYQCLVTLISGWLSDDASDVISYWQARMEFQLDSDELNSVRECLRSAAAAIRAYAQVLAAAPQSVRPQILQRMAVPPPPDRSPGTYLITGIAAEKRKNPARTPRRSDIIDTLHACYFPYVDIATCDRFMHATILPMLAQVAKSRSIQLIRTGKMSEVVAAIQGLPAR